jgi:HSP20 family protein
MALLPRITRDPALADFVGLSNRLGRLLNDGLLCVDWQPRDGATTAWVPPVDIFEEDNAIRIMAEIPGVRPEDVKLTVENNVLTIQGSKQQVAEERADRVHRYERTYGTFERSFTLPTTVDAGNIKATYENGVLSVTLPKVEKAKPRQIEVQVAAK